MNAGEVTLLETGVWIIPLFLFGTVALLFVLVRSWQSQTQQNLRSIQTDLRGFSTTLRQLQLDLKDYSIEDREPYGSEMKALQAKLEEVTERVGSLQQQYADVRGSVNRLSVNRWQTLLAGPLFWLQWWNIRKQVGEIHEGVRELREAFSASQSSVKLLSRRGWEIAGQARQAVEKERQAHQLLDKLGERHVRGELFESAVQRARQIRSDLERIPGYFLEAGEEEVLARADKDSIADVYEILAASAPAIDELLEASQRWDGQYREIEGRVASLRQAVGEVEALLATMPPEMIVEPYQERLQQLKTISDNLHATLSRLELESLPSIQQEADRVRAATQEMADQLKHGRRKLVALERILDELNEGLRTVSAQFAALAKSPSTPVVWNKSRGLLTDLSRRVSALGEVKQPRLPEQVEKDLAAASSLLSQLKDLTRHCQMVANRHAELAALLSSPELADSQGFFRQAQHLAAQASMLAPQNWPAADGVASLAGELSRLAERHERLVYTDPASSVYETEIEQEVAKVRELVSLQQTFRTRLERIRLRYLELVQVEKDTRECLQVVRSVLNQAELLARSNVFLDETAASEISGFRQRLEELEASIDQRGQGLVEEKARAANSLMNQLSASGNSWLERLNQDIEIKKRLIAEKLDAFAQIAQLDERVVDEAQRLLSEDLQSTVARRSRGRLSLPLEELIHHLKPRSDYWQSCVAAMRGLEEIEKPLLETHQLAVEQYDSVKAQLSDAARRFSDPKSWPPTAVSLEAEIQEFNLIEGQWQALETQHNRAISIVRQLGDLHSRLQALSAKVSRAVERGEQEQRRINDLEIELDELFRHWQSLAREYPDVAGEIRQMGIQINREVDDLKRQYRQGAVQYNQVLQSFKVLCQNVQNSQVTLPDGQPISLSSSGRPYPRRF